MPDDEKPKIFGIILLWYLFLLCLNYVQALKTKKHFHLFCQEQNEKGRNSFTNSLPVIYIPEHGTSPKVFGTNITLRFHHPSKLIFCGSVFNSDHSRFNFRSYLPFIHFKIHNKIFIAQLSYHRNGSSSTGAKHFL